MTAQHRPNPARPPHGLTVIEMMVTVMVLAVILALAVPSLRDFMARQRVKAVNAELVTDLQFARTEAVARNREVYVTFRMDDRAGEPPMTCYTVHTLGTVGGCDCRKPIGTACDAVPELVELKTVQLLRDTTATFAAPAWPANRVGFSKTRGLSFWNGHDATSASYVADWVDFPINVESSIAGRLRTSVHITGRPQVCSPDASISGVTRCAE